MKIVHVIWALSYGGSETMLIDIINEQCLTQEVHLIIVNDFYHRELLNTISNEVHVHMIHRIPGSFNPFPLIQLNVLLGKLGPTVIHCHNHDMINAVYAGRKKMIYTVHDVNIPADTFRKFSMLIAISQCVQQDIYRRTGLHATLVYNGVKVFSIRKQSLKRQEDVFRIVQISRLQHTKKGQDLLLLALHLLNTRYGINKIHVDFIGNGASLAYLKELACSLKLDSQVTFMGAVARETIYRDLCRYDLLVQPSRFEGFGLTVVEAMAAKIPVLVSGVDGPVEIIGNGRYGYHFETGNAESLAGSIMQIMENYGKEEMMNRINTAYNHVVQHFDISNTAGKYLSLYSQHILSQQFQSV